METPKRSLGYAIFIGALIALAVAAVAAMVLDGLGGLQ